MEFRNLYEPKGPTVHEFCRVMESLERLGWQRGDEIDVELFMRACMEAQVHPDSFRYLDGVPNEL